MFRSVGIGASFVFLVLACSGVALVASRYLFEGPGLSDFVMANANAAPWLVVHVAGGVTALVLGPWQFLTRLRNRAPRVHRWIGRAYVATCAVGGTGGLVLALGTVQGPIARWGFLLLALVWLTTTLTGWRRAVSGDYAKHGEWMIRSFSLTFAAVTLRVYLPLGPALGYDFDVAYRAIAWLCWVPNLVLAELVVRWRHQLLIFQPLLSSR